MIDAAITMTGVAGAGPPDEIVHDPGDGDRVELLNRGDAWLVRVHAGGDVDSERLHGGFESAFARFAAAIAAGQEAAL